MSRPARPCHNPLFHFALPVALLLLGAVLRAPLPWTTAPFDVDEALYATFARQISHENNPYLLGLPVDKPPLAFFVTALSFKLFTDPSEWAARLPTFYASVLSLAALWALAWGLYRSRWIAALAVTVMALAPLDVALAGSVFVDPLLALFVLLACAASGRRQWGPTMLFTALAFTVKQSALQALPLIVTLGLVARRHRQPASTRLLAIIAAAIAILPFAWDAARQATTGWWALGLANNAPQGLVNMEEVIPRLLTWLDHLSQALGGPIILTVTITGTAMLLRRKPRDHHAAVDLVLILYSLGWLLVYWLLAFNMYDRYVHPVLPLAAILFARSADVYGSRLQHSRLRPATAIVLLIILASLIATPRTSPVLEATRSQHIGIVRTATFLNTLPPGTIVYDRWIGWLLWWYTGQRRPPDMWLRLTYYPTPVALVTDALRQPDPQPRYFVAPSWAPVTPWLRALSNAGFSPQVAIQQDNFTVYRLIPPPAWGTAVPSDISRGPAMLLRE
ncbi:MAG: hypothetical protein HPY64_00415 [Anaerolineae bacterium]|nr:hypothetical protein [Anaerolineae bacterium]